MAFRSKETNTGAILILACLALAGRTWGADLRYEVKHDHLWKFGSGTLTFSESGVAYQEHSKKAGETDENLHRGAWAYQDIQQLYLAPRKVSIRTYKDRKWRLGADEQLELTLEGDQTFEAAYDLLKTRLDQRFVAAFAEDDMQVLWEVPVKLNRLISGSEGVLQFGPDRIVYKTPDREEARTWRYEDIENVSSSGPFQFTITTYEKSGRDYGDLRALNFQLKQPLDQKRYDRLWRRLNQIKDVDLITSIQDEGANQ